MTKKNVSTGTILFIVLSIIISVAAFSSEQALLTAIKEGKLQQVKSLLETQPDLIKMDLGGGAGLLHLAAHYGQQEIGVLLIKRGIDPNGADTYGRTALHYAFGKKNLIFSKMLIDNGADINCRNVWGRTLAYNAARNGYIEGIKFLMQNGADINRQDEWGKSPLHAAVDRKLTETIKLLLKKGAKINSGDRWQQTPLFTAGSNKDLEMIDLLVKNGADIRHKNSVKQSLLHRSAISGYIDITKRLIELGGHINSTDAKEMTPLDYARRFGHRKLAELLKASGGRGSSHASNFGYFPFDKQLLKNGEAVVWYLGHSGWAVRTSDHFLIFDYYENTPRPEEPKLVNGRINPEEIKNLKVVIFCSHEHQDHFDKTILDWKADIPDSHYVFGWKALEDTSHTYMGFRKKTNLEKLSIESVHSPEAGELEGNFLVTVDGLTIYHSGDYSRGHDTFKKDMVHLSKIAPDIDLFFMLAGNDMDNREAIVALERVKPQNMFPMHAGGSEYVYKEFAESAARQGIKTKIFCGRNRGDMFLYRKKKVTKADSYKEILNQ